MRIRTLFYCSLFLALPVSAAITQDTSTEPTVLVKVKKQKPTSSFTSGPQSIITDTQLSTMGITTLSQALQNLGNVQLQDMSGNGSQVNLGLRGFGANATSNTLLLINGIPLTNPDMAAPDLNAIPVYDIEYIEIIAGSESVLYGDQAVGGIINLVTRKETPEKFALSCSAGSYHQYNCYIGINHRYDRLNVNMTVANNHSNNYRDHNDYDQTLLLGKLDYPYSLGNLHFYYKIANEYMQYPGALTEEQVRQNRRQANNSTDYFRDLSGFFHLTSTHRLTSNWGLQTDIAHREMSGHGVLTSPFDQSRNVNYIKPQLKGMLGSTMIIGGLDVEDDHYHITSTFGETDNKLNKYGLFGIANVPLYPRLLLSAGARGAEQLSRLQSFTDDNNINRAFATTLGLTYQLLNESSLYLRRAESFRFPKADENASSNVGVTGLRTQRGVSYETGVQIQRDQTSAKLGLYQLDLKDEIAFDPTQTPEQPFGSNRNLSPTVRRGLTASGKQNLTDHLTLDGQYNYVNAEFQDGINAGNRIPLVSENILRGGLNYRLTEHWNIYTEAVYTGSQYAANDDANVAGLIGGYTLYHVNLHYIRKQLTASFRVNNIFNKYYYFYTVYDASMQNETFYPAPGRNVTFIINYLFG